MKRKKKRSAMGQSAAVCTPFCSSLPSMGDEVKQGNSSFVRKFVFFESGIFPSLIAILLEIN